MVPRDAVVSAVFFYPVKGCRGIRLARGVVERRGLRHDRRWMVVDESGTFVTQRTEPVLALVDAAMEDDALVVQGPTGPSLRLPSAAIGPRRRVTVWRDEVEAIDCGAEARDWISRILGKPATMVFMPDDVLRPVKPGYAQPGDIVGFADSFPLLVASASSLEALNARMAAPLPMNRFRPNIVVEGCAPWAEDSWARVRIGDLAVRIAKSCTRCAVTTTDQRTAERGVEPLRTLASFRRRDNDVHFAQNGIPDGLGTVAIGDRVTVLETRVVEAFDGAG